MRAFLCLVFITIQTFALAADGARPFTLKTRDHKEYAKAEVRGITGSGLNIWAPGFQFFLVPTEQLPEDLRKAYIDRINAARAAELAQAKLAAEKAAENERLRKEKLPKNFEVTLKDGTVLKEVTGMELEESKLVAKIHFVGGDKRVSIKDLPDVWKKNLGVQ